MLDPSPISTRRDTQVQVIFQGFHPVSGRRLSIVLQAEPYDQASAFWFHVCAAVADCFGIKCGLIPWLANEVKWEAITIEQGRLLSTIDHEPLHFSGTVTSIGRHLASAGKPSTRTSGLSPDWVMTSACYTYGVTEFRI
jgi:hypothetical protein